MIPTTNNHILINSWIELSYMILFAFTNVYHYKEWFQHWYDIFLVFIVFDT